MYMLLLLLLLLLLLSLYYYRLNEAAWYANQSFMLFKQSSGIHFIYLLSKKKNK